MGDLIKMQKLYKIICSNCNKSIGTLLLEDELNHSHFLPFLLLNELYSGERKSLSIGNDIKSPIYCSDCAQMKGGTENDTQD